jgi:hypothetical protein
MWLMRETIRNALMKASKDLSLASISFPSINTDEFGKFPLELFT